MPARRTAALALALGLAVTGCGSDDEGSTGTTGSSQAVAITSSDSTCELAKTAFAAGEIAFDVENTGKDVTEGEYEVACKPGQTGDGIRTEIEVSGEGGSTEAAYDREVEISARDYSYVGLTDFTGKVGEKVEFKLKNISGDHTHDFVVKGPDGKEVGEVEAVGPGDTGEAVLTLATAGTYTYECSIGDHASRGMKGTFTVS